MLPKRIRPTWSHDCLTFTARQRSFFKKKPRPSRNTCIVLCREGKKSHFPEMRLEFDSCSTKSDGNRSKCEGNIVERKPPHETLLKCRRWLTRHGEVARWGFFFRGLQNSRIPCVNLPFPNEAGSSESMCCGFACLRLDMVQPSGAERESCKQIFLSFFNWFLGLGREKKLVLPPLSSSSRNAHVNVIIIINNALRFITVPWQLIGSSPSAHILFKFAAHWWARRSGRRGREEAC